MQQQQLVGPDGSRQNWLLASVHFIELQTGLLVAAVAARSVAL